MSAEHLNTLADKLVYVASPYSGKTMYLQDMRYMETMQHVTILAQCHGIFTYSPILHWHEAAMRQYVEFSHAQWLAFDKMMLNKADAMILLAISGWPESKGMKWEWEYFRTIKPEAPIFWYDYECGAFTLTPANQQSDHEPFSI